MPTASCFFVPGVGVMVCFKVVEQGSIDLVFIGKRCAPLVALGLHSMAKRPLLILNKIKGDLTCEVDFSHKLFHPAQDPGMVDRLEHDATVPIDGKTDRVDRVGVDYAAMAYAVGAIPFTFDPLLCDPRIEILNLDSWAAALAVLLFDFLRAARVARF